MPSRQPLSLELLRRGDEAAMAAAIARMMPAIRRGAAFCAGPGMEFEDAVQEGIIGLFRAIQTYDPGRGASFETYAGVCALNAQIAAARSARSKKHGPLNDSVPLEESGTAQSPEELAIAAERYQQIVREMEVRLSELERQVLALYLAGCSARQIGQRLGRDEKRRKTPWAGCAASCAAICPKIWSDRPPRPAAINVPYVA